MTLAELHEALVLAESEARGLAEGRAKGVANSILTVLAARKLPVSDDVRGRIEACTDIQTLDLWLVRAATAASPGEVFEG